MGIAEAQLETWSNQGATVSAQAAHEAVRLALNSSESPLVLNDIGFEIYLQGSYRNSTNIRGNSDVDVVVQLNSSYQRDISGLTLSEQQLYKSTVKSASYGWPDFRVDVLSALRSYFGWENVTDADKCLKLPSGPGRVAADVVPCIQYRRYRSFSTWEQDDYVEGMKFYTRSDNREVINYPKVHYKNGADKNQNRTGQWYKPTTRMFKNARDKMIELEQLEDGLAPSYFLECLLYNVPNSLFGDTYQITYLKIIRWLLDAKLETFTCQNEQLPLFGETPEQWSTAKATVLISALALLWSQWSQ